MTRATTFLFGTLGMGLALSISAAQITAGLLFILWIARTLSNSQREPWQSSSLDGPILAYYVWGLVTWFMRRSASMSDVLASQDGVLLFFIMAHAARVKDIKALAWWFCVASALAGLLGIIQRISGVNHWPDARGFDVPELLTRWPSWLTHHLALENFRAAGTRSHPLTYAESLVPAFFLVLAWVLTMRENSRRNVSRGTLGYFALFFIAGGIVFAQGRAVWLAVTAGVIAMATVLPRKEFLLKVLIPFAVVGMLFIAEGPRMRQRMMSTFSESSGSPSDQESKNLRFEFWKASLQKIKQSPMFGEGLNGLQFHVTDPETGQDRVWTESHNLLIQVAAEQGLVGLGLLIWVLVTALKLMARLASPWRAAMVATLVACFVAGLTESWINDKEIAMIFWTLLGTAEGWRLRGPTA